MIPALQTTLDPFGPQAAHIHFLWVLFLWVSVGVYIVTMTVVLATVWHKRPAGEDSAESSRAGYAVAGATVVTIFTLFVLLAASAVKSHALAELRPKDALKIRLTGNQWWWDVVYLNSDPTQEIRTANEIHIPVGRAVQFDLSSADVIHSFWVPNLHGKTDLMPGKTTVTWLRADRPGVYRGQCAEFCGLQHAHMAFFIFAETQDTFVEWYATQLKAAADPAGNAQRLRGREVLVASCGPCHTVRGTAAGGRYGPDLTHVASRRTIAAGTVPLHYQNLRRWVSDPQQVKPGNNMPSIHLANDLEAVVSYLVSLK